MVELSVGTESLEFRVRGFHVLCAFRRKVTVPRHAVRGVGRPDLEVLRSLWKGWRAPGTHVPGLLVAGTFYRDGERHFWDVRHARGAVEIQLQGAEFDRLFVEVDDPERTIAEIEQATRAAR